jgi:hypothetical protein
LAGAVGRLGAMECRLGMPVASALNPRLIFIWTLAFGYGLEDRILKQLLGFIVVLNTSRSVTLHLAYITLTRKWAGGARSNSDKVNFNDYINFAIQFKNNC